VQFLGDLRGIEGRRGAEPVAERDDLRAGAALACAERKPAGRKQNRSSIKTMTLHVMSPQIVVGF
jgi:hypothetical protein